ncbi:hypothetical protein [Streptomyces sp. ODS28]|uniref:hypothetical protein n=1 Tax=Streptomyces sp. ODS28 TaxID=3136688 RepID=UPI0031EB04B1
MSEPSFSFPDDLVAAQRALHRARHELSVHYRSLPALPREARREQTALTRELEARVAELAATLFSHAYWSSLSGPDLVQARSAIQHIEETGAVDAGPAPEPAPKPDPESPSEETA